MEILSRSGNFWKVPNAVAVSEDDAMEWIKDGIKALKLNSTLDTAHIRSGNTIVEIERNGKDESGEVLYKGYVFTNYEVFELKG